MNRSRVEINDQLAYSVFNQQGTASIFKRPVSTGNKTSNKTGSSSSSSNVVVIDDVVAGDDFELQVCEYYSLLYIL